MMLARVMNGVLFYVSWIAIVGLAGRQQPVAASLVAAATLLVHFAAFAKNRLKEAALAGCLALSGLGLDSLIQFFDIITFASPGPIPFLAPAWIAGLHAVFATSLYHSLWWLLDLRIVGALLCATAAALSYGAGNALGAAIFPRGEEVALGTLALTWACYFWFIKLLTQYLDARFAETNEV